MISTELKNNNQLYHLFCVDSVVTPRSLRLALLYLSILSEIAISALFHDLSPSDDSSAFDSESLTENFWVGLYSVVITLILMSLIGLTLRFPPKWSQELVTFSTSKSMNSFRSFEKRLGVRLAVAFTCWFFLSCLLCLYLVGFGEIANQPSKEEWLTSSLISLSIDMSAFEVLPAFLFACLGWLVVFCKMKCLMCGVVLL